MNEWLNKCHFGDCVETMRRMPDGIVQTCVTSPPYFGLRDYGHDGQIGLEPTPEEFVAKLVDVFREVRRVLRDDGTLWLNLGDSYNNFRPGQAVHGRDKLNGKTAEKSKGRGVDGLKEKDLMGIPWRVAFALQADGWYLRQDIIWHKPNPMPESVTDRCTKAHEYIFLLSKSAAYHYDHDSVKEPARSSAPSGTGYSAAAEGKVLGRASNPQGGLTQREASEDRNKRSVWTVATKPYSGAHFATFPTALIEPCILAGAPAGGVVLDPFFGSGTTGEVSQNLGRAFIGCELNTDYSDLQKERLRQPGLILENS